MCEPDIQVTLCGAGILMNQKIGVALQATTAAVKLSNFNDLRAATV
jgi:hypothetical protein